MIHLSRETDAHRFNEIINHPDVRPDIDAAGSGWVDVSPRVADPNNVLLVGEYGGGLFHKIMAGVYEVHTAVLPEGRGPWARELAESGISWIFLNTDCFDLATRVPEGHVAAKALTLGAGFRYEFTTRPGAVFRGKMTAMASYGMRIQDWAARATGFDEMGRWLHKRMGEEAKRLGVTTPPHGTEDDDHYRYVGICYEMARCGQLVKAVALYNRWAILSRHPCVEAIADDVPAIRMDIGIMRIVNDDVEILPCA